MSSTADILGARRILAVSNREPYTRHVSEDGQVEFELRAGGLVTALTPVMRSSSGVWIAGDSDGEARRDEVPHEGPQFLLRQVPLSEEDVESYYRGFANRALWPLCHYFIDACHFAESQFASYQDVNQRFAEAVVAEEGDADLVWVHDYHFMLLPKLVRERSRRRNPIAYFHHIPFPPEAVFRVLPWRREILVGLLGADFIGFHTEIYVKNFLESCAGILQADVDLASGRVRWDNRSIDVSAYPIGIETAEFEQMAGAQGTTERSEIIRRNIGAEKIVLGVDRLDYSKGILQRLYAIERLFELHPEFRGKVSFVQVAVPSRTAVKEYEELKRGVDETVGRINGRFSNSGWTPVIYLYRGLPREELVAYYRAADVCLITPLRDGMNLVAKEYVACKTDDDGVLILSEFAGASAELDTALLVNPYSIQDMAVALQWALTMEAGERQRRMKQMRDHVREYDVHKWLESIVSGSLRSGSEAKVK
ncbi:MAG: trehalose-6-phosphate synthase [Myxococcota bacterium]